MDTYVNDLYVHNLKQNISELKYSRYFLKCTNFQAILLDIQKLSAHIRHCTKPSYFSITTSDIKLNYIYLEG